MGEGLPMAGVLRHFRGGYRGWQTEIIDDQWGQQIAGCGDDLGGSKSEK